MSQQPCRTRGLDARRKEASGGAQSRSVAGAPRLRVGTKATPKIVGCLGLLLRYETLFSAPLFVLKGCFTLGGHGASIKVSIKCLYRTSRLPATMSQRCSLRYTIMSAFERPDATRHRWRICAFIHNDTSLQLCAIRTR